MKTLITNVFTLGKFIGKENEEFSPVEVLIENQKISAIAVKLPNTISADPKLDVIDGQGLFLSPGLIDPQVHFREPGLEYKEDIESGARTAAKGGFTTVVSMPNTMPTADRAEVVKFMNDKQSELNLCRVLPTGAVTYGLKGQRLTDFAALKNAGAVALTDDGKGIQSEKVFKQALEKAKLLDLIILDHSEDESLSAGGAIHLGKVSEKHGIKGIKAQSESAHVERGCRLSGETGCRYHVLHISTADSLNYVRKAKEQGFAVTAEVSPHHLLFCDEDIALKEDDTLDAN